MNARTRTKSALILVFSLIIIFQTVLSAPAGSASHVSRANPNQIYYFVGIVPLQTVNSTTSQSSNSSMTVTRAGNATVANATTSRTMNTTDVQFQIRTMNEQLSALSSKLDALNQENNADRTVAILAFVTAILAVVGVIAVARRADSLYASVSGRLQPAKS